MRKFLARIALSLLVHMVALPLLSQTGPQYQIKLNNTTLLPSDNIDPNVVRQLNTSAAKEITTAIIQFNDVVSNRNKNLLFHSGVRLINYLGGRAYLVSLNKPLDDHLLKSQGVRNILPLNPTQKIHPALMDSLKQQLTVHLSLFSFIDVHTAIIKLNEYGFKAEKVYDSYPVLQVAVTPGRLVDLASIPFVEYIESMPPPPSPLLEKSISATRGNLLQSPTYNLSGEGVVLQINEVQGEPQNHIDFFDRSINALSGTDHHATHVYGIATGAGLINETYQGYAPKARFVTGGATLSTVPLNVLSYGVDLTNNSYATGVTCPAVSNSYGLLNINVDKQAVDFPHLLNIIAAGNSGQSTCTQYPLGYNTVYSGYQSAKSTLTVGNTLTNGELSPSSSRGPAGGGRIKPEIVAPGTSIWSTVPNNSYAPLSGTSMAAPAVTGGLGLLYQRYMMKYGAKPPGGLMKALICNTATDMGTPGPDYSYGFGLMNLNRAVQTLDAEHYFADSISHGQNRTKTINVPNGTAQLKVMLYWLDPPSSPLVRRPLVNDLDLRVSTPNNGTSLPYLLDTLPAQVANAATRGADHVNNIEQVVIDEPAAGNYTIHVSGYEVPDGLQRYYVVYDFVPNDVQLTYPSAGQSFAPGEQINVQWDAAGSSSTYKLEFSSDEGNTWNLVSNNIQAASKSYSWTLPSSTTNEAIFRLTRNVDGKASVSGKFQILGIPTLQLAAAQCPESVSIIWSEVLGATDYEIMMYRNGDMQSIGTTTEKKFLLQNLSADSIYWFGVRARNNGVAGRRAIALSRKPDTGDCSDITHDNDLKLEALISPTFGRR